MIFTLTELEANKLDAAHMYAALQTAIVPLGSSYCHVCYRL